MNKKLKNTSKIQEYRQKSRKLLQKNPIIPTTKHQNSRAYICNKRKLPQIIINNRPKKDKTIENDLKQPKYV